MIAQKRRHGGGTERGKEREGERGRERKDQGGLEWGSLDLCCNGLTR